MKIDMTAAIEEKPAPEGTSTAVLPAQSIAPGTYVNDGDAEGEFTRDDVDKVYLAIVAKTGELADTFTPGDLLLNKEFVIGGAKSPVNLVALGIKKRYQQDLDFNSSDEMGQIVDKAVEVANLGGVVGYRDYDDKVSTHFYKPILQVVFLVERPENLSPDAAAMFPYTIDGKDYGIIGYTARTKTAYNGIAKPLIQQKQAKGSVRGVVWQLSTKGETYEGRSWIQPKLRSTGATSEAITKFLAENYDS